MSGVRIISGLPGRIIDARNNLESKPPPTASIADEASLFHPGLGA